ncbi:MAG TPA: tRNA epoxyqueuosine(34) reductase QueG [Bacteroidales bacterium]|nr:tRNA epoxyqueuosine(34) reductase QueG [Bacteroidales bacterium]
MAAENISLSALIRKKAFDLGFDLTGFAEASKLEGHSEKILSWCEAGMNGGMNYLSRDLDKRTDPRILFPGAKSVIVTGLNYYTEKSLGKPGSPVISKYAYGGNYHEIIIDKLNELLKYIRSVVPSAGGKAFVDSAPLLEKAWARRAGLGWPGKHSVLINRSIGSFFFIGILLTDIILEYDEPVTADYCGNCRLCIDSCPTGAINDNRTLDVRRCIAYQTIEQKEPMEGNFTEKSGLRIFGCDICQDACPWNERARHHNTPEFEPSSSLQNMTVEDWLRLTKEDFKRLFGNSAIGRKKYETFMKNVETVLNNPQATGSIR